MATSVQRDDIEIILRTNFSIPVGSPYDENVLQKLRNFEVKDSDIFLIGHPKTGTTWAQEMIWLLGNSLDFEGAKTFIDERFPVLELFAFYSAFPDDPNIPTYYKDSLTFIKNQKSPRFIKTHMRGSYLPSQIQDGSKKPKIIYIARDAKDTCLSMYHYFKTLLKIYNGTLEDFCKVFLAGRMGAGLYWDHVLYFWRRRSDSNIMFIKYEDMKKDLSDIIRKVAKFLDTMITEEQVESLVERLSLNSMKKNPAVNHNDLYNQEGFIRVGEVGSFKKEMPRDMIEKFDVWTRTSLLGTGLNM